MVCTVGSGQCGRAGLSIGSADRSTNNPQLGPTAGLIWYKASFAPRTTADLRYALMASSWADEMAEEALMPALNFTALLDDAQAAARDGLSSGDEDTAATLGQRREGSRARAADRAVHRPPDIQLTSPAAATSASTRPAPQPRELQFDQQGAPPPPFIAPPNPRPVIPILVEVQQPGQPPHAWPVEHGIRVANGLHDITSILQDGNELPMLPARSLIDA